MGLLSDMILGSAPKKKRRRNQVLLLYQAIRKWIKLEFKSHSEPHIKRQVERSRLQKVNIVDPNRHLAVLVRQSDLGAIEDIEEISDELQLHPFTDRPGIISVKVKPVVKSGASKFPTTTRRDFARVQVGRVSKKLADRNTRLPMEIQSNV